MTKNVNGSDILEYVTKVIDIVDFPTHFSIDFAGFFKGKPPEFDKIFQFASWNSGIKLYNEMNTVLIGNIEVRKKVRDYFTTMSSSTLLQLWFAAHDEIGLFSMSGFSVGKIVSVVIYLEPSSMTVSEILDY